jgi:hypothetical protein
VEEKIAFVECQLALIEFGSELDCFLERGEGWKIEVDERD